MDFETYVNELFDSSWYGNPKSLSPHLIRFHSDLSQLSELEAASAEPLDDQALQHLRTASSLLSTAASQSCRLDDDKQPASEKLDDIAASDQISCSELDVRMFQTTSQYLHGISKASSLSSIRSEAPESRCSAATSGGLPAHSSQTSIGTCTSQIDGRSCSIPDLAAPPSSMTTPAQCTISYIVPPAAGSPSCNSAGNQASLSSQSSEEQNEANPNTSLHPGTIPLNVLSPTARKIQTAVSSPQAASQLLMTGHWPGFKTASQTAISQRFSWASMPSLPNSIGEVVDDHSASISVAPISNTGGRQSSSPFPSDLCCSFSFLDDDSSGFQAAGPLPPAHLTETPVQAAPAASTNGMVWPCQSLTIMTVSFLLWLRERCRTCTQAEARLQAQDQHCNQLNCSGVKQVFQLIYTFKRS